MPDTILTPDETPDEIARLRAVAEAALKGCSCPQPIDGSVIIVHGTECALVQYGRVVKDPALVLRLLDLAQHAGVTREGKSIAALTRFVETFLPEARMMSDPIYGTFHGGDPRNFSPDPECSTEEERQRHKDDCEKWERAEREGIGSPDCQPLFGDDGKLAVIVTRSQYGLGVNCDGEMQEIVHYAEMALNDLNPWRWLERVSERAAERVCRLFGWWW